MVIIRKGEFDFGVIIHEGRFTYPSYGLECLIDLGNWWEGETGMPIPLGGIAVRRDIDPAVAGAVEQGIGKSVRFAFENPEQSESYIKRHAQEMEDDVIRQHIQRVLQKTQGKVHGPGGAAELLGINANTLRNRMNKLGITYGRKKTRKEA